jgi:hypothetical protein
MPEASEPNTEEDRMRLWPQRRWLAALAAALGALALIGIPTGIVETPFYSRMTPVTWWDYPIWAASGLLIGAIAATYVRAPAAVRSPAGRTFAGGIVSVFAVGCPICNKLVVAALGVSGALNLYAPVQPFLGLLSILLLGTALVIRLRGERACRSRQADLVTVAGRGTTIPTAGPRPG